MIALAGPEMLKPGEVAKVLRISVVTLARYREAGLIQGIGPQPSGKYLYARAEVERVLNGQPRDGAR